MNRSESRKQNELNATRISNYSPKLLMIKLYIAPFLVTSGNMSFGFKRSLNKILVSDIL